MTWRWSRCGDMSSSMNATMMISPIACGARLIGAAVRSWSRRRPHRRRSARRHRPPSATGPPGPRTRGVDGGIGGDPHHRSARRRRVGHERSSNTLGSASARSTISAAAPAGMVIKIGAAAPAPNDSTPCRSRHDSIALVDHPAPGIRAACQWPERPAGGAGRTREQRAAGVLQGEPGPPGPRPSAARSGSSDDGPPAPCHPAPPARREQRQRGQGHGADGEDHAEGHRPEDHHRHHEDRGQREDHRQADRKTALPAVLKVLAMASSRRSRPRAPLGSGRR